MKPTMSRRILLPLGRALLASGGLVLSPEDAALDLGIHPISPVVAPRSICHPEAAGRAWDMVSRARASWLHRDAILRVDGREGPPRRFLILASENDRRGYSVEQAAHDLGFSPRSLHNHALQWFGFPPGVVIGLRRMASLYDEIRSSTSSLSIVAELFRFPDLSATVTLANPTTQGDALILVVGAAIDSISGVSGVGATWQRAVQTTAIIPHVEIWYALNIPSQPAGAIVSITHSGTPEPTSAVLREYGGIDPASALDRTASSVGTGTIAQSGTTSTTALPNEVWVGGLLAQDSTVTFSNEPAGWTRVDTAKGTNSKLTENTAYEEMIASATGAAGVTARLSQSVKWVGAIATFKRALAPPPCPGGTCLSQTCNLSTSNSCGNVDTCFATLARWCQSDGTIGCEVASDCPRWSQGHCNVTTSTACAPNTPTTGCPATEVCVPGDACHNGTDTSTSVTLSTSGGTGSFDPDPRYPYDPSVLPPPQSFRAWAPQNGTVDMKDIYLNWCEEEVVNTRTLPTVTEYDVYRSLNRGGPHKLFARLDPACLLPGNRCEIMDPTDPRAPSPYSAACINKNGTANATCGVISPTSACSNQPGASVKPCAIVDMTFETYNSYPNPYDTVAIDQIFNYYYAVTAKGRVGTNPVTESEPSKENAGWLNYYCNQPCGSVSCNPGCIQRRDPDGEGDYLVCSSGHLESSLDPQLLESDPAARPLMPQDDSSPLTSRLDAAPHIGFIAPHRSIGGKGGPPPYKPPSKFVFFHDDHLGSPRVVVDEKGVIQATHHYLPFGDERPLPADPVWGNRAFTGHERDKESGLDYMLARYYSSSLGRFMAVDPSHASVDKGDPQAWNRYVYSRNNPLKYLDPDGKKPMPREQVEMMQTAGKNAAKAVEAVGALLAPGGQQTSNIAGPLSIGSGAAAVVASLMLGPQARVVLALASVSGTAGIADAAGAGTTALANPNKETVTKAVAKIGEAATGEAMTSELAHATQGIPGATEGLVKTVAGAAAILAAPAVDQATEGAVNALTEKPTQTSRPLVITTRDKEEGPPK